MKDILNRLQALANSPALRIEKARAVAQAIKAARAYRWVGLYDVTPEEVVAIAVEFLKSCTLILTPLWM